MNFVAKLLVFTILVVNVANAKGCLEKRVTLDIGSGSIKSSGFIYDTCIKEVKERLGSYDQHLKYEACIVDHDGIKTIKHECVDQTQKIVSNIEMKYAVKCGKTGRCNGVATAWARKAANSNEVLDKFREGGIDVTLLSQKEEGELGYKTVSKVLEYPVDDMNLIVFDIGGASFQLSTRMNDGDIDVLNGPDGVESFNKKLMNHFAKEDVNQNPYITKEQIKEVAKKFAPEIKALLEKNKVLNAKLISKDYEVIAIGRPMYVGMAQQMDFSNTFTKTQVLEKAVMFSGKTPSQANKKFPKIADHFILAAQASLVYVYTIMEATGIDSMTISTARPTDYLVSMEY